MSDEQFWRIVVSGVCFAAIYAFTPPLLRWLAKRGIHYRSMSEQREHEEREK